MGQRPQRPEQPVVQSESLPASPSQQPGPVSSPPERPAGQPGGGGGGRPTGGGTPGGAENAVPGVGTVPQLAIPADRFVPLTVANPLLYDTIVPSNVPYKVIHYASRIMAKYDLNGNGVLEREEWSQMPGAPQSIDTDGDFVISLEEMIRFIALYGNVRTIHRPNPPPTQVGADWSPTEVSVFRPFSAPPKPKPGPDEAQSDEAQSDGAEAAPTEEIVENPGDDESTPEENTAEQAEESGETTENGESNNDS